MYGRHFRGASTGARILIIAAAAVATTAPAQADWILSGPAVDLGQGTAQAWFAMGEDGKPSRLGVNISDAALRGIDALPAAAVTLPLPPQAAVTGFDHVLLNWNPHGHPPAQIWDSPHFDVHFYMISPEEREAVSEQDPDFWAKAARHPEAQFVPVDYVLESEPIPGMGVHWADSTTPELHGAAFTQTLIYGSWDGRFTFIEPMITKAVLDERKTVVAPVKQAASVATPGWYPTRYRIEFDPVASKHRIVLEGLVERQ